MAVEHVAEGKTADGTSIPEPLEKTKTYFGRYFLQEMGLPTVDTLQPMISIGKLKSELDLIIGVPTVQRSNDEGEVSYFMKMLLSIVNGGGDRKGLGCTTNNRKQKIGLQTL